MKQRDQSEKKTKFKFTHAKFHAASPGSSTPNPCAAQQDHDVMSVTENYFDPVGVINLIRSFAEDSLKMMCVASLVTIEPKTRR